MKHRCVVLALLAVSALPIAIAPASADEPDIEALLEDAKPAGDRWEQCAAAIAKAELRSRRSADDLAERALAGCKREEAALKSVLRKEIGPERAETVTGLVRDIYRTNLIRAITTIRDR